MKETIQEFAERISDAYSSDRYNGGFAPCIRALRIRKYDDRQIEAMLRSKWTRWAADASSRTYGHANSADFLRFLDNYNGKGKPIEIEEVKKLTEEHFFWDKEHERDEK